MKYRMNLCFAVSRNEVLVYIVIEPHNASTYERMVLQVEECADVLISLNPKFDILLLFNHS